MSTTVRSIKDIEKSIVATTKKPARWRWYHGAAFYVAAQAMTFGLSGLVGIANGNKARNTRETFFGDVTYFNNLKQAKITPPSQVFAPAWTINNISMIYGTLKVLNKPEGTPGRKTFLALQAATWIDYMAFSAAYFSLRSPINALLLTVIFFALTIASGFVAVFRLKDTKVALSLATLFIWLTIATTAAVTQALWNKDDLYKVGPFVQPDPKFVK